MEKQLSSRQNGLTVIELIIVMLFFSILFGTVTINMLGSTYRASMNSQITTLISDIKNQQLKAMAGETATGGVNENYGIYFATDRYILFRGSVYNVNNPSNFTVNLDPNLSFPTASATLPGSSVIFSVISGEISGFAPTKNSLVLSNVTSGVNKTLTFNKLGTIITVN